ncbi:MAG: hypothetical protein M0017_05535 [Desulfobacteraceae bacterium]|nr:hypothetical protein [Desulfobacteraceae bacterium]
MTEYTDRSAQALLREENLSQLEKYALLAVGSRSLLGLLYSEMAIGLWGGSAGAFGYFIRQKAYRRLFKAAGQKPVIGKNVTIRGSRNITLGNNVFIDDQCVLDARGPRAAITIEDGCFISRNTIIRTRNGEIVIGREAVIGCNCLLGTDSRLHVGAEAMLAAYVCIVGGKQHRFDDPEVPIIRQQGFRPSRGGVEIGPGAWLGVRTTVLDGVVIGKGTVVGAHSLVNRSLPEMSVAFGSPARVRSRRGESPGGGAPGEHGIAAGPPTGGEDA